MQFSRFLLIPLFLIIAAATCTNVQQSKTRYKGKLEIAGICMNYTIRILSALTDSSLGAQQWTDDVTGKSYAHVFRPCNPCSLPDTLKQGDEFYFVLIEDSPNDCSVCMAYYPTPANTLCIKVVE